MTVLVKECLKKSSTAVRCNQHLDLCIPTPLPLQMSYSVSSVLEDISTSAISSDMSKCTVTMSLFYNKK